MSDVVIRPTWNPPMGPPRSSVPAPTVDAGMVTVDGGAAIEGEHATEGFTVPAAQGALLLSLVLLFGFAFARKNRVEAKKISTGRISL